MEGNEHTGLMWSVSGQAAPSRQEGRTVIGNKTTGLLRGGLCSSSVLERFKSMNNGMDHQSRNGRSQMPRVAREPVDDLLLGELLGGKETSEWE